MLKFKLRNRICRRSVEVSIFTRAFILKLRKSNRAGRQGRKIQQQERSGLETIICSLLASWAATYPCLSFWRKDIEDDKGAILMRGSVKLIHRDTISVREALATRINKISIVYYKRSLGLVQIPM